MTFLQPILLYALPLILLPVLIHLLNRLRHRTQQWGAMRFLVAASRSSVNRARLKQFLILLFRTLAVLMSLLRRVVPGIVPEVCRVYFEGVASVHWRARNIRMIYCCST